MGLFTYVRGPARCVRCGASSDGYLPTKLFKVDASTSCAEYRVGDRVFLDDVDWYAALHPWTDKSRLSVAMGDWTCAHCSLGWQWARVDLEVTHAGGVGPNAVITRVSELVPLRPDDLAGIHFVDDELARLSAWAPWTEEFLRCSAVEKANKIVAGYRAWAEEVAGVEL